VRRRLLAVAAVAAIALTTAVAAPAQASTLPDLVWKLDHVAVQYTNDSDAPRLHFRGWAADLLSPTVNGSHYLAMQFIGTPKGGSARDVAWAENDRMSRPRPDVAKAYPGLGADHGFDTVSSELTPGPWTICMRLYDPFSQLPMGWVPAGCTSVTIPASRPAYRPAVTDGITTGPALYPAIGTTLYADPTQESRLPSAMTFAWGRDDWNAPVPGGTNGWYTTTVADSGEDLFLTVTMNPNSALPIEQTYPPIGIHFPASSQKRLFGSDRYGTNVAASQDAFPDSTAGVPVVYLASGANYPDALAAGPAAVASGGDLLLTTPTALPASISTELVRLHPATVVIVGGTGAVSAGVETAVHNLAFHPAVTRIAGIDRYDTARKVVDYAFPTATSAYLVSGEGFADAVTAGASAAATGRPVLLVNGRAASADQPTLDELTRLGTTSVTIAGGPSVVSAGIAASLGAGITVDRRYGSDRFQTATAIASAAFASAPNAFLANALNFPDALSTAILAGKAHAPLYLSNQSCIPQGTLSTMLALGLKQLTLVGGYGVMNIYAAGFTAC
jgi:putative cell wall-binding protein